MAVKFDTQAFRDQVHRAAGRGLVAGTEAIRKEMVRLIMQSPATGREYHRRGVTHRASAPGEPPASDTGFLVNSIRTSYDLGGLTAKITIGAKYALMLEYGTQSMEPRPFVRPALAHSRDAVQQLVTQEISNEFAR